MKIRILIRKKPEVLDIEGKAVKNALSSLGIKDVAEDVKKGYFVELEYLGKPENIENFVNEAAEKLLVNSVIEAFEYEILEK